MQHAICALLLLLVPHVLCSTFAHASAAIRANLGLSEAHDAVLQQIVRGDSPYATDMTLSVGTYTPGYLLNRATIVYALNQAEVFAPRFALIAELVTRHNADPSEVHRGHSALNYMHYWRHAPQLPQLVAIFASSAARDTSRCARWTNTASHISKFVAAGRMDAVVALCTAPCHIDVLPAIMDTAMTPAALPAMNALVSRLSTEEYLALMRMPWVRDSIASMLADRTLPEDRVLAEAALRLRRIRVARLVQAGIPTDHRTTAELFEEVVRHVSNAASLDDDAVLMIDDGLKLPSFVRMISVPRMLLAAASGPNSAAVLNLFAARQCVTMDSLGEAAIIAAHARNWTVFAVLLSLDEEARLLEAPAVRPHTEPFAVRLAHSLAHSLENAGVLPLVLDRISGTWATFFFAQRFVGPSARAVAGGNPHVAMRAAVPLACAFARADPPPNLLHLLVVLPSSTAFVVSQTTALERMLNANSLPCSPVELAAAALSAGETGRPIILSMATLAQAEPHAYLGPVVLAACEAHAAAGPAQAAEVDALVAAITEAVARM